MRHAWLRLLGWFAFGAALLAPSWASGQLVGQDGVDVWNHAWGLWWWADRLAAGEFPWHDPRLSWPGGGTLWFVDPVGATALLPVTLTLGPAVAWNLLAVVRVMWAAYWTERLALALGANPFGGWVAGAAFATSPYLLAELHNGISEVWAVGWIPLTLHLWLQAVRGGGARAWALTGLALGGASLATPYYGLALGLPLGLLTPFHLGLRADRWRPALAALPGALAPAAAVVALWRAALGDPQAVIQRHEGVQAALAFHNAVDIQEFFRPGTFTSVDYARQWGNEQFLHTGYLRWTVLALAILTFARGWVAGRRWLLGVALLAVTFGLGERLYFKGQFVFGAEGPRLPFGLLVDWVPGLAITHPARLAVPAATVLCALAGLAIARLPRAAGVVLALGIGAEGLFGSVMVWPVSSAPAAIPALYQEIAASPDARGVLDLPPQVRKTMRTSVYFWYQTVHQKPIPWWPDVRTHANGDPTLVRAFTAPPRNGRPGPVRFAALTPAQLSELRARYGWVVVHSHLDRSVLGAGEAARVLTEALGPAATSDGRQVWRVPAP